MPVIFVIHLAHCLINGQKVHIKRENHYVRVFQFDLFQKVPGTIIFLFLKVIVFSLSLF